MRIHINNRSKYGNIKSYAPQQFGEKRAFDSKKERDRFIELYLLNKAEKIQDLRLQPEFKLIVNDILICKYRADFEYKENGVSIVEDAKGVRTKEYILKKKLMKAILGIEIKEV